MALLKVLQFPDQRLRKKAKPVIRIDAKIKQLTDDMLETMYYEQGIGLAATQINKQQRIIVIDLSEKKNQPLVLINPDIAKMQGQQQMREGCLSVPDYFAPVSRAKHIQLTYTDVDGNTVEIETDGLLAVCIQHEIDHLDGKLFIDYLSPLKRERLQKRLKKQKRTQNIRLL